MNNAFLKSALILSVATLLSKILGSIFRIPLQNIAGDEVLGIFSLVYPVYMVALTLSVAGIPVAISKLISEALVRNDHAAVHKIYRTSTILTALFGLLSFLLITSFSGPITNVLGGPSTRLALIVVSVTLLIAPFFAVYRGYFQGFQDMRPTAISQVLEQLIRVGFILGIAYLLVQRNYSDEIVSGGVMAASFLGALASGIYLLFLFKRSPLKPVAQTKLTFAAFKATSKKILVLSLPICIGAITMALINFVDSTTIPLSLRGAGVAEEKINYTYGIYSRGLALVQIATVFSTSIVLPLIPLITKTLAENKITETRSVIERTHRMTHLISWPAAFGLLALTLPLNLALFTNTEGSAVLAVIGFSAIFTSLTILGTGILQGMNLERKASYIILAGVLIKIVTNIVFIRLFGLIGAGYSTLFVYLLIFIFNTYFIWKSLRFTIWTRGITVMAVSAFIMGAVIGLPTLYFDVDSWSRTMALLFSLLAAIVGALIYFALLLLTKTIKLKEFTNLPVINKFFRKTPSTQAGLPQERGKGVKTVNKMKKLLWGLLILSLIISIPGIFSRFQVEWNNRTYEMVIPYKDVDDLVRRDASLDERDVVNRFKEAGLQGISLEPDTLESLEHKGEVTILTFEEMKEMSLFDPDFSPLVQDGAHDGLGVIVHDQPELTTRLGQAFPSIGEITFKGRDMILISGKEEELLDHPLQFAPEVIELVHEAGLDLVLRIPNEDLSHDQFLFEQALLLADEKVDRILFLGEDVLGFPESGDIKAYSELLRDNGYGAYIIEPIGLKEQKGFATVAHTMYMDIIRLHSLSLKEEPTQQEAIARAVRAVKERNIRTVFINLDLEKEGIDAAETVDNTESLLRGIQQDMPSFFQLGKAEPFETINVPLWSKAFALLAAVLFVSIAVLEILKHKWLFYLSLGGLAVIALGSLVLQKTLLIQGLALLVALATPVLAIIPVKGKETQSLPRSYGRAVLISAAGIAIIVALLNGNEYLIKLAGFRGVKLIYVFPIAFMFIYALWGNVRTLLNANVKYWHLIIIAIVGAAGLYYLSRTGNEGSASSIELMIRQLLEEWLYVRPRTKEFLIGLPIYVLALYLMRTKKLAAMFLLVPGVIGFLSIVNTFTHLHIPLYVSILRTAYGLVLGLLFGYLFIFLYKKGMTLYEEQIKPRWFT